MKPLPIAITDRGPADVKVLVDGHDVTHGVSSYVLRNSCGRIPELTLEATSLDVTTIGDARVRVAIGREIFDSRHLLDLIGHALRSGDARLADTATRLHRALPLPPLPDAGPTDDAP